MDKWQLIGDFEWHDLPVDQMTIGVSGIALLVTPYSEEAEDYRHVVLTLRNAQRLELTFPQVLERADLANLEVSSFEWERNEESLSGELTLLAANKGVFIIGFDSAEWDLEEHPYVSDERAGSNVGAAVWVFKGANSSFPSGVFSSRDRGAAWIRPISSRDC